MKQDYQDLHNYYKIKQQNNYITIVKIIQNYFMIKYKNIIFIDI